nr:hypothetical protein Iba_chr10bCG4110 [Ipomoea batatas]GMD43088.1 hypothetical protein Iba_chr10cCG1920 [Ipomoea batatas]
MLKKEQTICCCIVSGLLLGGEITQVKTPTPQVGLFTVGTHTTRKKINNNGVNQEGS